MSDDDARRFASYWNRGDTRNLGPMLADHCVCYRSDQVLSGRDAVVAWCSDHWEDARPEIFGSLAGQSVQRKAEGEYDVVYFDAIRRGGEPFVYKRRLKIVFDRFGKIDLLVDRALPEERERLRRFIEQAGAEREEP